MTQLTFRQLCDNDPAIAVRATIDGLLDIQRVGWLKLDMNSYATEEIGADVPFCWACAASFVVLQLKFPLAVPNLPIEEY